MIVATAGHVDHGKTSLVRALTGVDTDRLPEEKRRGMTIDLGFAYLPVDAIDPIGFVDVPGHERFIHNMLSGLSRIDLGLLIVAADDGPMPQTFEHLSILRLLGTRRLAVALTKIDRVAPERVQALDDELTLLTDAPVFRVSAPNGIGIHELKDYLVSIGRATPPAQLRGNFRMAIDRAFTVDGAGLVTTGTVVSGSLRIGEQVRVLPGGCSARVRSIHAQNRSAGECREGQRCGLNLTGPELKRDAVVRGAWLVSGPVPDPVRKFDARVQVLASEARALEHWTPVHVHIGALDVSGRVAVLEATAIGPGSSALAQITLDNPAHIACGDPFILRDQSAQRTIGGGRAIDVFSPARHRASERRLRQLRAIEIEDDGRALDSLIALAPEGFRFDRFASNRNLSEAESAALFASHRLKRAGQGLAFGEVRWRELRDAFLNGMRGRQVQSEQRVFAELGLRLPGDAAAAIVAELVRDGLVVRDAMGLRLPAHQPKLDDPDSAMWQRVQPVLKRAHFQPPNTSELAGELREDPKRLVAFLSRAARLGLVVRLADNRYMLPSTLEQLGALTRELAASSEGGLVTAAALRDRIGGGRKVAIEILEYFDRTKFTRRVGDARTIIGTGVCYSSNR